MTWVWVVLAVVIVAVLVAAAWVSSGPRFQARSRGSRPGYGTQAERDALSRNVIPGLGQPGGASRGPK